MASTVAPRLSNTSGISVKTYSYGGSTTKMGDKPDYSDYEVIDYNQNQPQNPNTQKKPATQQIDVNKINNDIKNTNAKQASSATTWWDRTKNKLKDIKDSAVDAGKRFWNDKVINSSFWDKPIEWSQNTDLDEKIMASGGAFIYGFAGLTETLFDAAATKVNKYRVLWHKIRGNENKVKEIEAWNERVVAPHVFDEMYRDWAREWGISEDIINSKMVKIFKGLGKTAGVVLTFYEIGALATEGVLSKAGTFVVRSVTSALLAGGNATQKAYDNGASFKDVAIVDTVASIVAVIVSGVSQYVVKSGLSELPYLHGHKFLQAAQILLTSTKAGAVAVLSPITSSIVEYFTYAKDATTIDLNGNEQKKYSNFFDYYKNGGGLQDTIIAFAAAFGLTTYGGVKSNIKIQSEISAQESAAATALETTNAPESQEAVQSDAIDEPELLEGENATEAQEIPSKGAVDEPELLENESSSEVDKYGYRSDEYYTKLFKEKLDMADYLDERSDDYYSELFKERLDLVDVLEERYGDDFFEKIGRFSEEFVNVNEPLIPKENAMNGAIDFLKANYGLSNNEAWEVVKNGDPVYSTSGQFQDFDSEKFIQYMEENYGASREDLEAAMATDPDDLQRQLTELRHNSIDRALEDLTREVPIKNVDLYLEQRWRHADSINALSGYQDQVAAGVASGKTEFDAIRDTEYYKWYEEEVLGKEYTEYMRTQFMGNQESCNVYCVQNNENFLKFTAGNGNLGRSEGFASIREADMIDILNSSQTGTDYVKVTPENINAVMNGEIPINLDQNKLVDALDLPKSYAKDGVTIVQSSGNSAEDLNVTTELQQGSNRMFVPGMHTVHVPEMCARPKTGLELVDNGNGVYTDNSGQGVKALRVQ